MADRVVWKEELEEMGSQNFLRVTQRAMFNETGICRMIVPAIVPEKPSKHERDAA